MRDFIKDVYKTHRLNLSARTLNNSCILTVTDVYAIQISILVLSTTLRNVVKYVKYSPAKLANFVYSCITCENRSLN